MEISTSFPPFCISVVLLIFCTVDLINSSNNVTSNNEETVQGNATSKFYIFHSLQPILDALRDDKYKGNAGVANLLETFENQCMPRASAFPGQQRQYPFIAIEGTYRARRKFVAKSLSLAYKAFLVSPVPRSLILLRQEFEYNLELKRLFFALSMYINAARVKYLLEQGPVVLSGYWMDQAAYQIAKEFKDDLPPPESSIYEFPSDLLRPDLVLYINLTESTRRFSETLSNFNQRMDKIMLLFREPSVVRVNSTFVTDDYINELKEVIKREIGSKFPYVLNET